jgi:hypothetical protein
MARRKKQVTKRKTTTRRRRRIGAISSDTKGLLMQTLGGIGGAVIGSYVGKAISDVVKKQITDTEQADNYAPYIEGGVQVAVGYFLPKLIKQSTPIIKGVQMGMLINGGITIVKATGALDALNPATTGAISNYNTPMVAGVNDMFLNDARSANTPMVAGMYNRSMGVAMHA